MTLKSLSILFTLPFVVGGALTAQAADWSRQVGPEPALEFATRLPSNVSMSQFGEEVRAIGSIFGDLTHNPGLLVAVDAVLTNWAPDRPTFIPESVAQQFFVPMTYNGETSAAVISFSTPSDPSYGLNIANSTYQGYLFNYWVPDILLPHSPNALHGTPTDPSHPTYVAIDGFSTNYTFYGLFTDEGFTPYPYATWGAGYPQNPSEWEAAWVAFFAYAKQNAPSVRLCPHVGTIDFSTFQTVFADCPAMEKEYFALSSLSALSEYQHGTLYGQITSMYWFSNVAPPVFSTAVNPNEPHTRVLEVGIDVDTGDIQTALAFYSLYRGPNTFFSALSDGGLGVVDPGTWLPAAQALGAATSAPTVLMTASGQTADSGYVVWQRTWAHGVTYVNLSGRTQTITTPSGATNWYGASVSSITLGNGQGAVVFF